MLKRINFDTWQELEPYWIDGLIERFSLIWRSFLRPVLVRSDSFPVLRSCKLDDVSVHTISSFEALDLPPGVHDLVLLTPFLQWTQDVPGILTQAYHALAEDGFFVACFFGQDTLIEFKSVCAELDLKYMKGLQQRFLPTIHTKDAAMLMQRAGFSSPTSDIEHLCFSLTSVDELVRKMRDSGLTNAKVTSHMPYLSTRSLPKCFYKEAQDCYIKKYPHSVTGINVSVDLIFMCGWKQSTVKSSPSLNSNPPTVL